MNSNHSIVENLRKMSAMILDLDTVSNVLTEEQQIQAVLHVLAQKLEYNEAYNDTQQQCYFILSTVASPYA